MVGDHLGARELARLGVEHDVDHVVGFVLPIVGARRARREAYAIGGRQPLQELPKRIFEGVEAQDISMFMPIFVWSIFGEDVVRMSGPLHQQQRTCHSHPIAYLTPHSSLPAKGGGLAGSAGSCHPFCN